MKVPITKDNIILIAQCTPDNGEMAKREFRIKGKVPRERISDYLFLTTSVKGEFWLIRNFLLLPSCPDYPEYTVIVNECRLSKRFGAKDGKSVCNVYLPTELEQCIAPLLVGKTKRPSSSSLILSQPNRQVSLSPVKLLQFCFDVASKTQPEKHFLLLLNERRESTISCYP